MKNKDNPCYITYCGFFTMVSTIAAFAEIFWNNYDSDEDQNTKQDTDGETLSDEIWPEYNQNIFIFGMVCSTMQLIFAIKNMFDHNEKCGSSTSLKNCGKETSNFGQFCGGLVRTLLSLGSIVCSLTNLAGKDSFNYGRIVALNVANISMLLPNLHHLAIGGSQMLEGIIGCFKDEEAREQFQESRIKYCLKSEEGSPYQIRIERAFQEHNQIKAMHQIADVLQNVQNANNRAGRQMEIKIETKNENKYIV